MSMLCRLRSLSLFIAIAYLPLVLFAIGVYSMFALSFWLEFVFYEYDRAQHLASSVGSLAFGTVLALLPLVVVCFGYWAFLMTQDWRKRGWILYATWFAASFVAAFIAYVIIGGPDGPRFNSPSTSFMTFASVLALTGEAHLLFVPWVIVSIPLLKKIGLGRRGKL